MTREEVNALTRLIDEDDASAQRDHAEEQRQARQAHLQVMRDMSVYTAVQREPGQARPMTVKWVDRPDKVPATARLTARGYEQPGTKHMDFYAATPSTGALRMLVALALHRGWTLGVGDAERAFLQAALPEEDAPLYVWPPREAEEQPGTVWQLHKALPGLKGSAQVWG